MAQLITVESLGEGATEATVRQFERACQAALEAGYEPSEGDELREYIWNDGRFDIRIRELLGEEVAV